MPPTFSALRISPWSIQGIACVKLSLSIYPSLNFKRIHLQN
jgi:hypothetical protein